MGLLRPATKAAYVVRCNGFEFEFTQFSGINDSAETGTFANGTGNRLRKVIGPRQIDDVTLTSPYDPDLQADVEAFYLRYNCELLTITVQPTTCGNNPQNRGNPYILHGCQLQALNTAEVDRESGDPQTIELILTVDYWNR